MTYIKKHEEKIYIAVLRGELEIDNRGHIWRIKKQCERVRAENNTSNGYLQIRVMIDGIRYHASAHRLIWLHSRGPIPDGLVTNHKNGNKADNRLSNLEMVTPSENRKHAFRTGLINQDGERNPGSKLSNADVEQIRLLYASGNYFQMDLAEMFGVAFQTISKIVRGERRKTQDGPVDSNDHRSNYMERDLVTGQFTNKRSSTSPKT